MGGGVFKTHSVGILCFPAGNLSFQKKSCSIGFYKPDGCIHFMNSLNWEPHFNSTSIWGLS